MISEFLLYSITLFFTVYYFFSLTFKYSKENVALTCAAIAAAPIAWGYFIFPVMIWAVR